MFHDHHLHPFGYASLVNGLELMDAVDIDDLLTRVRSHADGCDGPVVGQRLNDEGLSEARLPTASDIDDVIGDRPVLLYRYCGHIAVANRAAMDLAGIDADTPDPPGGSFDRLPDGRPNGVLRETAVAAVADAIEPLTSPPSDSQVLDALATLPRQGIGSITGMVSIGSAVWCGVEDELATLIRLAPDLPVDVEVFLIASDPSAFASAVETIRHTEGRITFGGYKDFIDGSLGGHTAAMYEPFADKPQTTGTVRVDGEKLAMMGNLSLDLGGAVAIHAIGDRANDIALDIHEGFIGRGADPSRLRVEHASVLTDGAVERMAALGVTASIQPAFLASEQTWLEKRLGPHRMQHAYPFRSLLEAGVHLVGGSDSPVELPDPKVGIEAAVDRHGIAPEQALDIEQAKGLFAAPSS